jgi:hypothetical protein
VGAEATIDVDGAEEKLLAGETAVFDTVEGSSTLVSDTPISAVMRGGRAVPVIVEALYDTASSTENLSVPELEYSSEYVLPIDSEELEIVCSTTYGSPHVEARDDSGALLAQAVCGTVSDADDTVRIHADKAGLDAFPPGTRVLSVDNPPRPFLLRADSKDLSGQIIWGPVQSRSDAEPIAELVFGPEEDAPLGAMFANRAWFAELRQRFLRSLLAPAMNEFAASLRDFRAGEDATFAFTYKPQRNIVTRFFRSIFSERQFELREVNVRLAGSEAPVRFEVEYGEDLAWFLKLAPEERAIRPGKYIVELMIAEGDAMYTDTFEFYWGVLAINSDKSVYAPGEEAYLQMAALDDGGNTICDAILRLVVTSPSGGASDVPVEQAGTCGPNNVTHDPDYRAYYHTGTPGKYRMELTHLNDLGEVVHRTEDTFEVRNEVPFDIERRGPTRIYPLAPYRMELRVTAEEAFEGTIEEAVPVDFAILDSDGAELSQNQGAKKLSWQVSLDAGETETLIYEFDAPDISPYLFVLGPVEIKQGDAIPFSESRMWQIASDALGDYVEKSIEWTANSASTWETVDLSVAPFNVPANAVVEIAMNNKDTGAELYGGVRSVGSTVDRRHQIHEAEPQGEDHVTMHVQANSSSQIQHYAEDTTNVTFTLLGYWTSGTYVDVYEDFDANSEGSWADFDLSGFGVGAGDVAEIAMSNNNNGTEMSAGVRADGSSLDRRLDIHEGEAGGDDFVTMHVVASGANARIEAYAEQTDGINTDVDHILVGYWSEPPTGLEYNERFDSLGGPSTNSTWQDRTLSAFGVQSSGIAEILFSNIDQANSTMLIGVRTDGSSLARTFNIHEPEAGGENIGRAHVKAGSDASATIEYFTEQTADDAFRLIGHWSADNLPPATPTFFDDPFSSEKLGSSTPQLHFASTDPDGPSGLVYEIQFDDDPVVDDAPLVERSSDDESGCSPACFSNADNSGDTSPFTDGDMIRFQIQSPLTTGTTYYWRVRATDEDGAGIESEWTDVQSFTFVEDIDPPQWFQTQDTQFEEGTLDNVETSGSHSLRIVSSAPTEALVAYGEGTTQTPRYRIWNGAVWSAEQSAQNVGGTIQWVVTRAGTQRNEYVLGTQDASSDVNVQVYDGDAGTWDDLLQVTGTISDTTGKGFDIAYETQSGDAVVVYCDGDADPSYRVWDGSNWSGAASINLATTADCEWVAMASDPTSDELIMVSRNTGTQYEAQVWDGSAWGNSVVLGAMDQTGHEGMAVEYEESGDQAVVAVSDDTAGDFEWTSWNGSDWSVVTIQDIQDDFEWGVLKRDEGSDSMALCYADQDDDLGIVRWDGAGWQDFQEFATNGNTGSSGTPDGRPVSCEFETTAGRDGFLMIPYSDNNFGEYQYWDGANFSSEATISTITDSWTVSSVRTGDGKILATFHDDDNDRYDFSYWDGSTWAAAQTLENSPSVTAEPMRDPIAMAAKIYQPAEGTITSDPVDFDLVPGQPTWGEALWNTTEPSGTDVVVQVLYATTTECTTLVPDSALSGNSTGFDASESPLDLSGLSTVTYNELCLRATLSSTNENTPTLNDWTLSWERQPFLTQEAFRWYANANANTPTDAWPSGSDDLGENEVVSESFAPSPGDVLRLRLGILDENVALGAGDISLKLQYAEGSTCSADLEWTDVGDEGSPAAWRGFDNAGVSDGDEVSALLLSGADIAATYEEENNTAVNPNQISVNEIGEWDFVIEHNATSSTEYCFRVIHSDATELNAYENYPQLITNSPPSAPDLEKLFDNEQTASTSPWFEFVAEDPKGDDLSYEIQIDDDPLFGSVNLERNSLDHFNEFSNLVSTADKNPFTTGETVRFIPTSSLSNGTTYWWRVRARDPNGSNDWSEWSTSWSFTVNTATAITTWFQTTQEQFDTDSLENTETTASDDVQLTGGFTTGTTTGPLVDFDWRTTGNAWGSLSWNEDESNGDIRYHLQYRDSGGNWTLIPDSDLSGNAAGFGGSSVTLLGLDPTVYNEIRPAATFTNIGGTPELLDWTLAWGLAVEQPTQLTLFDNEKTATTTPSFTFFSSDPQSDDLQYEIEIDTSSDFSSPTTRTSGTHAGFSNTESGGDTSPFTSGEIVQFSLQTADALSNGQTYWWRVRAIDPAGGNTWSVWSTSRSFTVDTSVTVSTWFQTTGEQFNTDTLSDTEVSGDSVQITSTIREAMAVYGEGTVQAPRYRLWNGSAWGTEGTAVNIGDIIYWLETAAAPTRDEYITVTQGSSGKIDAQVYDGSANTWGNVQAIVTGVDEELQRAFDVAYETTSGDAMVVACEGDDAVYRIWNGASWSSETTITLSSGDDCRWVRLAADPVSDEIILLVRDDAGSTDDYEAQVWNGSSWGNSLELGSINTAANEGMTVEYEESGNQAVVVASNGGGASFEWATWSGSGWSSLQTTTIGDDFEAGRLSRDLGSDNMALCYIDQDNDIGYVLWNGSTFGAFDEMTTGGNSLNGRPVDCEFETVGSRDGNTMFAYSDTGNMNYRVWNGSTLSGESTLSTIGDSWEVRMARTGDGNILALAYDDGETQYDFSYWNGTAWSAAETIEESAILNTNPRTVPIDLVARRFPSFTSGTVISSGIDFFDGAGPKWEDVSWSVTTPGASSVLMQIEYYSSSTDSWALVPDEDLSGNSSGTDTGPLDISDLSFQTYDMIRLKANLVCDSGDCPSLDDWTVRWSEGIEVTGTARAYDESTNLTSGTVALAVNGVVQAGKTATISSGTWTIPNVTTFADDVISVWIDGAADSSEAVAVTVYDGVNDVTGIELYERHLSIGSDDAATVANTHLAVFDSVASADDDIFFEVDSNNDLTVCASGTCSDAELYVKAGNTYRPDSSGSGNITTHDLENRGTLVLDGNTVSVSGSWENTGTLTANTSSVRFTATGGTETVNSTGASNAAFNAVTFGVGSGTATWQLTSDLDINGALSISFGTVAPQSTANITAAGSVSIGASGAFQKGTGTTTLDGASVATLTDSTSPKQDLGNLVINGASKIVQLGSDIRATDLTIGSDDGLDVSGFHYDIELSGNFANAGAFNPRQGTVTFTSTSSGNSVNGGSSNFYDLTFNGSGGTWAFPNNALTVNNNLTVSAGTVTLPNGTSTVAGSFLNTGGDIQHNNGVLLMTSTGAESIQMGASSLFDLTFNGSGGTWAFTDTNATSSNNVRIRNGTPTFPSGTFAIGGSLVRTGGSFAHNSGTVKFTSVENETVTTGGSSFFNLLFDGSGGTWALSDANATTTNDFSIVNGTTTMPSGTLAIGGSFTNADTFEHNSGSVRFFATASGKTIDPGSSPFNNITFDSASGGWTVTENATSTGAWRIRNASSFTLDPGHTVEVGGVFENRVGGSATAWAGSTLYLNSGTSYAANTKSLGGDQYGTLRVGANTDISMWNASSTAYAVEATGSLYSQDHGGVDGALHIFGSYARTSGTEYWSYATDFDGTSLAGSERAAAVALADGASVNISGATLNMIGDASASTTVSNQGSGSYSLAVTDSTVNAQYVDVEDADADGLQVLGASTIAQFSDTAFILDAEGGTAMTVASSTIDANTTLQLDGISFSLGGATTGSNVTVTGTPVSYWKFQDHYGDIDGEAFDSDPGGDPGNIRWDDSSFSITVSGNAYSDEGSTVSTACDGSTPVVRIRVNGGGDHTGSCSGGDGSFSIPNVTFVGDVVLTAYLDTGGSEQAVTVTQTPNGDITDLDLYENRLIVRHEDVAPLTIADLSVYDSDQDGDILYDADIGSPNMLALEAGTKLYVWGGKTFVPGGNISLPSAGSANVYDGSIHIGNNATFTAAGSESHSVGGSWTAGTGSTFTAANSTVTFTATTPGKSVSANSAFYDVIFSGAGGSWSIDAPLTVQNDLSADAGTVSGTQDITVENGTVEGDGAFDMTGGTLTAESSGDFGGGGDWAFYGLTFGDGATTASTTKVGAGDITVREVLTISTNHALMAGATDWTLTGSSTVFTIQGTFDPDSSAFIYAGTDATTITAATYNDLLLAPSGAGTPTYTLAAGQVTVGDYLQVGGGTNALVAGADANDTLVTVGGDMEILANAEFSAASGNDLLLSGSYSNAGVFTANGGGVVFNSSDAGESVDAGGSPFHNVTFNSATGGWTVSANASSTGAWSLTAGSFTQAPGTIIEVGGTFTNAIGGAGTTWTGATLYLNSGTAFSANAKSISDAYATLSIGAHTDVSMWNSSASAYDVDGSGSLYSQDHSGVDGDLYIWGDYVQSAGNGYWSYATDFDGTALSGSERQVDVRLADNATTTLSGGMLEINGAASATTTIAGQGSGTYALRVTGGTFDAQYYQIRDMSAAGLFISGTPIVNEMDNGDFELEINGGTTMTVAGSAITANPLKTWNNVRFATSSGVTAGSNVTATGASGSSWRFTSHYGNYAGESFDSDPQGDPGLIIWDDSAADITVAGNVYSDEGITVSDACDGSTQNVRLLIEGASAESTSCDDTTGAYSFSNIIYNTDDALTVYLDTNGSEQAATVTVDPVTNISDMHLYENRLIVRNEDAQPITIEDLSIYDSDQDVDILFDADTGSPNTLTLAAGSKLIVWDNKAFAPGGNIAIPATGSGQAHDGSIELRDGAAFTAAGTESHTIGGSWTSGTGATFTAANSSVTFTATTAGKTVEVNGSPFYTLAFNGSGGAWDWTDASGTVSESLTISAGSVSLPDAALSIGASFENTGGSFTAGTSTITFTGAGTHDIELGGSDIHSLSFTGAGSWTFADTDATSTGDVSIASGAVALPTGTLAVGGSFANTGGSFTHTGELVLYSSDAGETLTQGGSTLGGVEFNGAGSWTWSDTNATTTGDVVVSQGGVTLPAGVLAVGGSLTNQDSLNTNAGTLRFYATTAGHTINAGGALLSNVDIVGTGGGFTIPASATTTGYFNLAVVDTFTLSSGASLEVQGTFTNLVGGTDTTWTGSTLYLNSATAYTVNTKAAGGDIYDAFLVGSSTDIRIWNSSASTATVHASSSLYSQDHAAVDGDLYIWGEYARTSGADYWSYAKDFDGTSLTGGSERQVDVRIAPDSSLSFTGSTLEMVGDATATTTVSVQSAGTYGFEMSGGTLNASRYSIRNTDSTGLSLAGSLAITTISNGDFELGVEGGALMTVAASVINANPTETYSGVRFALAGGISSGSNIVRTGNTANFWRFTDHYGGLDGEDFDDDGIDECGAIRWADSTCLEASQAHFRFRNDDGGEGAPDSEWFDPNWTARKRITVANSTGSSLTDHPVEVVLTYDDDMQADFDDIRFTDDTGTTTLAYWVESFTTASTATAWVNVPSIPANSSASMYVYYGNALASNAEDGESVFTFFDDFEDDNINEYSGDSSLFDTSSVFNYEGSFGLAASLGNDESQTTDGLYRTDTTFSQGSTIRYFTYVDSTTDDEPCTLFGVQSPGSDNENYAVCLDQFPSDQVVLAKDVSSNDDSGTSLDSQSVTFATGWYEVVIDWLTDDSINVTVFDANGSTFATLSASDSDYTSGGMGFAFWFQAGGWDYYSVRPYASTAPTHSVGTEQGPGGATWKEDLDSSLSGQATDETFRLRVSVENSGPQMDDQNFRLQFAPKGEAPTCGAVDEVEYNDVPAQAGCSGSALCMVSSSNVTNQEASTQHLATDFSGAFTAGHVVEDPSNQTNDMTVAVNEVTEVEYVLELTDNAFDDAYCMRVTDGGLALDSYARIPEIALIHLPVISNWNLNNDEDIALTEGATTTVVASGTVTDLNGFEDIDFATSTIYRSGVGANCAEDLNNCYPLAEAQCPLTNCTGSSCDIVCTADMYYFAEPTDAGSDFEGESWFADVTVADQTGNVDTETSVAVDLLTLWGLDLESGAINYGSVGLGEDTGASNASTTLENTGNDEIDIQLAGTDLTSGESAIPVGNQKYATSTFTYSACAICNFLSGTSTTFEMDLTKPTSTSSPVLDTLYWGIHVPTGVHGTTHTGLNTFFATGD